MLVYTHFGLAPFGIRVALGSKAVGMIRRDDSGYYYQPKGSKSRGDTFATLEEVKRSLEEDAK